MEKIDELKLEIKVLQDKVKELEKELAKRPTTEEVDAKIKALGDWVMRTFPTC